MEYSGWKSNKWLLNMFGEESKVAKLQRVFTLHMMTILTEKRDGSVRGLLDVLTADEGFGKDATIATLVGFIILGYDRLASACISALEEMPRQIVAQVRVRKEVVKSFPINSMEAIEKLKVLENFILESQRLYPATPIIATTTSEGIPLDGFFIPPNISVLLYLQGTGRDSRFINPEEFDLNRNNSNEAFGVNSLASDIPMTILKIVLGNLVKKYKMIPAKENAETSGRAKTGRINIISI